MPGRAITGCGEMAPGSWMRSIGATGILLQTARKPNFVLDDHSSRRRITVPLEQPTRRFRLPRGLRRLDLFAFAHRAGTLLPREESRRVPCLFGLAPCGVYHADRLTPAAVRSYRTLSPLPSVRFRFNKQIRLLETPGARMAWRFAFCCTGRPAALGRQSRTLSGTLPCGVRTFLPRPFCLRMGRQRSSGRLQASV